AVAEDRAAGNIPALGLQLKRITGSLACLRALQLSGEVRDRHDQLVDGAIEPYLMATVLVFEDPHTRHADLLEDVVGLELFAPQAVLVGEEEGSEWGLGAERVEEPHQAGSPFELRPGDRVVDVGVVGRHLEAVPLGTSASHLDLACDRLLLVGDVLLSRLPGVDGGSQHDRTLWSWNAFTLRRGRFLLAPVMSDQQRGQGLSDAPFRR